MDRRAFHRVAGSLCASMLAAAPRVSLANSRPTPHSRIIQRDGSPLLPDHLLPDQAWIFGYPFRVTPCFLVRSSASNQILAFSAICTHKLTHPSRPISHIAYRAEAVTFFDRDGQRQERAGVISCCSERSVYDPEDNARVLSGPAPLPLARIGLEIHDDGISAVSTTGTEIYERFLTAFGFRLAMEHGISDVRQRVGDTTAAEHADQYSRQTIRC